MTTIIQGENFRFSFLTDKLVRLEYDYDGKFENRPTQIVQNRELDDVVITTIEHDDEIIYETSALSLYYKGGEFTSESLYIDAKNNLSIFGDRWYFGQKIDSLKGTTSTLDSANGEVPLEESIISHGGFGQLADTSFALDDNEDVVSREGSELDLYIFVYGHDYRLAIQDYYRLTGFTPLLPKYAFGNWWSRYHRYTDQTYLELMDRFESEEIPLSVSVIDMDWHRVTDVPKRFGSGWTGYSWDKTLFPNPELFLKALKDKGLAVTLNVHPAQGIRAFEDMYPAVAKKLGLDIEKEEPANFEMADKKFRETYFTDVHHPLEAQGVDFWWIDWQQGENSGVKGVSPLWLLNKYHYEDVQRKGKQDVILSRYAGPGSHRYPIGFSGDTFITWDSLNFQPYFTATATNIGYTWWSHDIGGHMGGYKDDELYLRWLQYGVFSPINRLHSSNSNFTGKEPWRYDSVIMSAAKTYLQLRHKLMPYLYTYNVKTAEEGRALIEPLYYEYPENDQAYRQRNQYFFGSQLMVAPVTSRTIPELKLSAVKVWFPEGTWTDFTTGNYYQGGKTIDVYRELSEMPVFAKAGAVIPLNANPMDKDAKTIEWHVYVGESGVFELAEDIDGKRFVTKGVYDEDAKQFSIETDYEREHKLVVHSPSAITVSSDFETQYILPQSKQSRINRVLDLAQISYDTKETIYANLSGDNSILQQTAFVTQIENRDLQKALLEILLG